MTKLVIFDLDGTLLNTIDDLGMAANYALKTNGYPEHPIEQYPFMVGNGVNKLLERSLPESERSQTNVLKIKKDFIKYYAQHNRDLTHPYPGIVQLLNELKKRGIDLAVASNKYQEATQRLIAHYFPNIAFISVFGQRDGVPIKPNPQIITDILSRGKWGTDQVLYIGDSGVDMQTARNAGLRSVGVLWGFRPKEELLEYGAENLADAPQEILNFL